MWRRKRKREWRVREKGRRRSSKSTLERNWWVVSNIKCNPNVDPVENEKEKEKVMAVKKKGEVRRALGRARPKETGITQWSPPPKHFKLLS